jgi:hypothetical protein
LDRVAAEREAERKRLVDESAKAAAAACGKTAAGAARGG